MIWGPKLSRAFLWLQRTLSYPTTRIGPELPLLLTSDPGIAGPVNSLKRHLETFYILFRRSGKFHGAHGSDLRKWIHNEAVRFTLVSTTRVG